jgi:hypothetical protein
MLPGLLRTRKGSTSLKKGVEFPILNFPLLPWNLLKPPQRDDAPNNLKNFEEGNIMNSKILAMTSGVTSFVIPAFAMADGLAETAKEVAGAVVNFVIPPAHAQVPEPSTMALLAVGVGAALFVAKWNNKKIDK